MYLLFFQNYSNLFPPKKTLCARERFNCINEFNNKNIAPLHYAISKNSEAIIKLLINNKNINLHIRYSDDFTFLHLAIVNKNIVAVKAIINNKTFKNINDIKNKFAFTPLHLASKINDVKIMELLLGNKNINVNIKEKKGFTPLHLAIQEKNILMMKLLLDHQDIDVNYNNNKLKVSPLHMAAIYNYNNPEIIQLLLNSKNINVNIKDVRGLTPLHIAVQKNNIPMMKLLLEHQDIDINSYDGSRLVFLGIFKKRRNNHLL